MVGDTSTLFSTWKTLDQPIVGKSRHNLADTFNVVYLITDGVVKLSAFVFPAFPSALLDNIANCVVQTVKITKGPTTTVCWWWWGRLRRRTTAAVFLDRANERRVTESRCTYYSAEPIFTRLIALRVGYQCNEFISNESRGQRGKYCLPDT